MILRLVGHIKGEKPKIELTIQRVEVSAWELFKKHHYLTEDINKSCKCFIFRWNGQIVGFAAIINTPRKNQSDAVAISRLVVLPDFQGLGIGAMIARKISAIFTYNGNRVYIKTINDALGRYFEADTTNWRATAHNGKEKKLTDEGTKYTARLSRKSFCYAYIGEGLDLGDENLLKPVADLRKLKNKPIQRKGLF